MSLAPNPHVASTSGHSRLPPAIDAPDPDAQDGAVMVDINIYGAGGDVCAIFWPRW
jgi:hypothetical protein